MADPLFWLALSFLLVVVSLTALLMVAIPALRELGRAARSVEKFFDTLGRELPPTLEAIRLTGLEITELTDDVTEGVQSAGQVVEQVNQSIVTAKTGAKRLNTGTKSIFAGAKAAWQAWTDEPSTRSQAQRWADSTKVPLPRPTGDRSRISSPQPGLQTNPQPGDNASGDQQASDRILSGHGEPLPQLDAATLYAMPEAGWGTTNSAEADELAPSRPAPESSRPANADWE